MATAFAFASHQGTTGALVSPQLLVVLNDMIYQLQTGKDHAVVSLTVMTRIGRAGLDGIAIMLRHHLRDLPLTVMVDTLHGVVRFLPPPGFVYPVAQPALTGNSIEVAPDQASGPSAAQTSEPPHTVMADSLNNVASSMPPGFKLSAAQPTLTSSSTADAPEQASEPSAAQAPTAIPPVSLAGDDSHHKGRKSKVARPMNCFILYRKSKHEEVAKANKGLHNKAISKIIGQMWRAEPEDVRAAYKQRADTIASAFRLANPNYVYRPRRSADVKRRHKRRQPSAQLAPVQAPAAPSGDYHVTDDLPDFDLALFENQAQVNMDGDKPHHILYNINPEAIHEAQLDSVRPTINMAPASTYDQHAFCNAVGGELELKAQVDNSRHYNGVLSGKVSTLLSNELEHKQNYNFSSDLPQLQDDEFTAATNHNAEYVSQGILEPYSDLSLLEREQSLDNVASDQPQVDDFTATTEHDTEYVPQQSYYDLVFPDREQDLDFLLLDGPNDFTERSN